MQTPHVITGTIERFIFQNQENGFTVFVLQLNDNNTITAKGYLSHISVGQSVELKGAWIVHPKFGKQFEAQQCIAHAPASLVGLKKYLGSGLIKGIGKTYAEKLVNRFGLDILSIIEKQPERLSEVDGIGPKRIETIIKAWQDQKEISSIMVFLQDKGISPAYAAKIFKRYGHEAIALITENPYRIAEDVWGIGFKMADQIAQKLGFTKESVKRIKAGILYAIGHGAQNQGHLYFELQEFKTKLIELLELDSQESNIKQALHELYDTEKIKLISKDSLHYITSSAHYYSEKSVAQKIKMLISRSTTHILDLNAIYHELRIQDQSGFALNDEQIEGILSCLQHKVTVITGGPGTGKTTLIKKLLGILDKKQINYKLAAPTGRAAKRIMEGTGKYALTLHRLLEFDPTSMSFVHNEQNALSLDFLIIDEASMIDIFLANSLLKAIPLNAHVLFIGDIDQLPSVGPGSFLQDLIASKAIPSIRLHKIFRQAQDSLIIINAHRINHGEFPTSSMPDTKKDFIFIKENDPAQVQQHLHSIFKQKLARYHISAHDATVLVPMNRGIVGTQQLNQHLQSILNPHETKQIVHAGIILKVGDKVMQIRNNYDKLTFNGDIGIIQDIDQEQRMVSVLFDERAIEYESDELDELVLAYALSIHKSQGSEYSAVIVPIFMQHFMLLQRNLIYTAITRAKKLCIFIGEPKAIAMAIKNNKSIERKTFLPDYLTTDLACR